MRALLSSQSKIILQNYALGGGDAATGYSPALHRSTFGASVAKDGGLERPKNLANYCWVSERRLSLHLIPSRVM